MPNRSSALFLLTCLGGFWILSVFGIIVCFGVVTARSTGLVALPVIGLLYVLGSAICWLSKVGKD